MSVAAPPTTTTTTTTSSTAPLFNADFEGGSLPAGWDFVQTTANVSITSTPPPGRSGNALQIHYTICGDSTNTACGAAHQDSNRWVSKIITPGLTHFFVRGYLYFKTPEPGATPGVITQRKLIRFSDSLSAGGINGTGATYGFMLNSFNASGGVYTPTVNLTLAAGATVVSACSAGAGPIGPGSTSPTIWDVYAFNYNTWYSLELEVQLNTPGSFDGIGRIWVNGVQVLSRTDLNFRDSCTTPVSGFFLGNQADRGNYAVVDEYRYWDDVVISQSYIGP
jgi:hypothetical protein